MERVSADTWGIVAAVCIAVAVMLVAKLIRDSTEPEEPPDRFPDYTKRDGPDARDS
jgi:hypothetical protein